MLICYDCEKEIRNDYLDKILKQNRLRNIINEQHSNIKRKLMDDDNISSISKESFYTDNNSYNPNSKKYKNNMRKLESSLNIRDSGNLVIDADKLSIHTYNGIITDYSKRRKKNRIRNNDNINKESNQRFSNIKNERKYNEKNEIKISLEENNINEYDKNKRISHNIDNDNNLNNNSSIFDENYSKYNERYIEEENIDNYTKKEEKSKINKNNYFNNSEENSNESNDNEINIKKFNKTNNENINKRSGSLINQNNNIEFNNIMRYEENDNFSENQKNSLNIPEKNNNIHIGEKNENVLEMKRQSENENNSNNSPYISQEKNENNDKRKKYKIYNENNNLYESSPKKIINNDNESIGETDEIHKSIYYEKYENNYNGESKYIRKDKIKKIKKVKSKSKSKNKKTNHKNKNNFYNKQLDNEREKENSEKSIDNIGEIIFKNKYVDSQIDKINNCYKDNNRTEIRKILYQDFYFREVSFSSSSSVKESIISNSKYNEDNNLRKSYQEDKKNNKYENYIYEINEPIEEFDKFIFEQINILRTNPKSFVQKIEASKKNIGVDKRNNYIYNGNQKILLNNGIYAFENAIKHLNVLRSMNKLNYDPKFNIKLPSNEEEINDRKYQNNKVNELLENKIKIKSFWREIIKDPEECFLLMIVDDCGNNCGFKRKDLLDPNMTSIGISSIKLGKYFACYIQLGKK